MTSHRRTDLRRPEPLDPNRHDRSQFSCGEPALDDWLRRYAGQNRGGNTAATWVISDVGGVVVAYASLCMSAPDLSSAPRPLAKRAPDPVPALLCGRLAVDRRLVGLGVGTALVGHVIATAASLNRSAAFKALVVTAINQSASRWGERFGFRSFDPDDPECFDLYLLTADLEATLQRLA